MFRAHGNRLIAMLLGVRYTISTCEHRIFVSTISAHGVGTVGARTDWLLNSECWADTTNQLRRFRQLWFELVAAENRYVRVKGVMGLSSVDWEDHHPLIR